MARDWIASRVVAGDVRRRSGLFRLMEIPDRLHLAQVKRMVKRLGLEGSTVFTGYVVHSDISAWFQAAHTVVLPYRRTEQSGVLSLARAFATPVITSDAGGLGEECGATWTFPAGGREALAELLSRLDFERPPKASASLTWDLSSFAVATEAIYRESRRRQGRPAGRTQLCVDVPLGVTAMRDNIRRDLSRWGVGKVGCSDRPRCCSQPRRSRRDSSKPARCPMVIPAVSEKGVPGSVKVDWSWRPDGVGEAQGVAPVTS